MNPKYVRGPLEIFSVIVFLILLENSRLDILPIISSSTIDYTCWEDDCKLVTLVATIFSVFTQGDDEGESSLYLG